MEMSIDGREPIFRDWKLVRHNGSQHWESEARNEWLLLERREERGRPKREFEERQKAMQAERAMRAEKYATKEFVGQSVKSLRNSVQQAFTELDKLDAEIWETTVQAIEKLRAEVRELRELVLTKADSGAICEMVAERVAIPNQQYAKLKSQVDKLQTQMSASQKHHEALERKFASLRPRE